ncbi:N-acetylneuraminate synthase [Pseudomonas sp. SL4(2022)]|uniref:N-acetylneuraminate synthase n=1 Tax=Pseudomonas sp. SL4(2022) TaxID=2994661 RepID=UPI0022705203|nr:N-acetylneuraminate synthase [Pseudomonas sp. SL4(2022)]WAC44801.1 N-acetylneuraminate synthase [Pseudomonas sp. SL4(2022)]
MNYFERDSVYIIAEAGVNHNGDYDKAMALVEAAAQAGADAVKFQTFNARLLALSSAPKAAYQKRTTGEDDSQLEMLLKLELPHVWHYPLQARARELGLDFLSTAFDHESLAFLDQLNLPVYKIPSGEITNGPLLWSIARSGRPMILSTGMATLGEIDQALAVLAHGLEFETPPQGLEEVWLNWTRPEARSWVATRVALLHCTSQYPARPAEVNLRAMDVLMNTFGLPVGYSDHTEGVLASVAAVARNASIVEKHFTLDRTLPGPDHAASLVPDELKEMVDQIRLVEQMMGLAAKVPQASEWDTRKAARQSLTFVRDVSQNQVIVAGDLGAARQGCGTSPMCAWDFIGNRASRDFKAGDPA